MKISHKGILLCLGVLVLLSFPLLLGVWQVHSLPDRLPSLPKEMSLRVLDRNGTPIRLPVNIRGERTSFLPLAQIPESIQHAFIVAEDKRFFQHRGVDWKAFARAGFQTLTHLRPVSGASTITMQLVRIYWPQLSGPLQKPAQILQALRIEVNHSKGEILTHYLNVLPFAYQVGGIQNACLTYFDKHCKRLTLAEASALAVLPRNPAHYSSNAKALNKAKNRVLNQFHTNQGFSKQKIQQAKLSKVSAGHFKSRPSTAPHFALRILEKTRPRQSGKIKTTLDIPLQNKIQEWLSRDVTLRPGLGNTGAVLVVDNSQSQVLAYVGSADFNEKNHGMVDTVQTLRSPGSTLKPFIYAYGLERDWTLSSLLPDVPMQFKTGNGVFTPKNYGGTFSGPRQMRFALANSFNLPALFMYSQLGESNVMDFFKKIGFSHFNQDEKYYGVGFAIGNGEVSLWELTQAYTILARQGAFKSLQTIMKKPASFSSSDAQVISPSTSWLIADVLKDPIARSEEFGRMGPLEFDFPVSVKTGTSSSYRDHWTLGFTPDYTVGIWKGNANGQAFKNKLPAAMGTGILFHQIIKYLYRNRKPGWFRKPSNVISKKVCSLSGSLAGPHCRATRMEHFTNGKEPKVFCMMHRSLEVPNCKGKTRKIEYVKLPEQYKAWSVAQELPTLEKQMKSICGIEDFTLFESIKANTPKILNPIHDSIFALDPTIPISHQKLRISFANISPGTSLTLWVNGKLLEEITNKEEIFWPLTKGDHVMEIRSPTNGVQSRVRFKVL